MARATGLSSLDGTTSSSNGAAALEYGVAGEVSLRWAVVDLTAVVEEARRRHDLSPIAAVALGRAMAGATLLLRLSARASRRLTLTVTGDGPIGKIVAEADSEGNLRGLVGDPQVDLPVDDRGGLRIAAAVGKGILRVRRELLDGSSYESQVALESGEIGLDLAHFLEQSEQTQSAVMVGVLEGPEGVRAAGGMVVEVMPGARPDAVELLEENLARTGGVSRTLGRGGLAELRNGVLAGLDVEVIDRRGVRFQCSCSRDGLLATLVGLPSGDLDSIRDDSGQVEAQCSFCGERYVYAAGELEES
ncbi:MAG: Hsp33 family molecular chaperone HslO [Thermoanaerobaculia bacterium]